MSQVWTLVERKPRNYRLGLSDFNVPIEEIDRLSRSMLEGKLPDDFIATVLDCSMRVLNLHPDYYPWSAVAGDDVCYGLSDQGIDTAQVWQYVNEKAEQLGKRFPSIVETDRGSNQSLTNLFEIYALTKFHNIGGINKVQPIKHARLLIEGTFPIV